MGFLVLPAAAANMGNNLPIGADTTESLCPDAPSCRMEAHIPSLQIAKTLRLKGEVAAVAWSPDGLLLATSENFNKTIEIWDVDSEKLIRVVEKQPASTPKILFTSDGKFLITPPVAPLDAAESAALSIIDVETGLVIRTVDGPFGPSQHTLVNQPRDFALSPDGRRLYVTFGRDGNVYIYDTVSWTTLGSIPEFGFIMRAGPGNDEITTMEPDGNVRVWSADSKSVVRDFPTIKYPSSMALATGVYLMASGAGPDGKALNTTTGKLESDFDPLPVRLWDLNSGKMRAAGPATQLIRGLAFSRDMMLLAATSGDNSILLFATSNLSVSATLSRFSRNALDVEFSPDGRYLAAAGDDQVRFYRLQ